MKVSITLDVSNIAKLANFYRLMDKAAYRLLNTDMPLQTVEWQSVKVQDLDSYSVITEKYEQQQQKIAEMPKNNLDGVVEPILQGILQHGTQ